MRSLLPLTLWFAEAHGVRHLLQSYYSSPFPGGKRLALNKSPEDAVIE